MNSLVSFRRHRLTHGARFLCINFFFQFRVHRIDSFATFEMSVNVFIFLLKPKGMDKFNAGRFFLCLNSSIWILISRKLDFIY